MARLNFIPSDKEQKICTEKCNEIISLLSDINEIHMKAYILHSLILSFRDASGIDLTKTFKVEEEL